MIANGTATLDATTRVAEATRLADLDMPLGKRLRLALEGGYNALACHWGLARMYMARYAGRVPLILKINGKTNVPSDDDAFSPLTASVEDAVSIGADAVGYTLYVGSPRQDVDIA